MSTGVPIDTAALNLMLSELRLPTIKATIRRGMPTDSFTHLMMAILVTSELHQSADTILLIGR